MQTCAACCNNSLLLFFCSCHTKADLTILFYPFERRVLRGNFLFRCVPRGSGIQLCGIYTRMRILATLCSDRHFLCIVLDYGKSLILRSFFFIPVRYFILFFVLRLLAEFGCGSSVSQLTLLFWMSAKKNSSLLLPPGLILVCSNKVFSSGSAAAGSGAVVVDHNDPRKQRRQFLVHTACLCTCVYVGQFVSSPAPRYLKQFYCMYICFRFGGEIYTPSLPRRCLFT